MKFLIDECLSPSLVRLAIAAGHPETTCVRDRGWQGLKDWELMHKVLAEDFTLVTHNSKDFRGTTQARDKGLHAHQDVHAGLVCLNTGPDMDMDLDRQRRLWDVALKELAAIPDLINQVWEITEHEDGSMEIILYGLP